MDRIKQKAIAQIIDVSIAIELKAGGDLDNKKAKSALDDIKNMYFGNK